MANTKKYLSILILIASKTGCSFLSWQSHLDALYDQDRHCKILTKTKNKITVFWCVRFSGLLFLSGLGAICTIYILQKVAMCNVLTFK